MIGLLLGARTESRPGEAVAQRLSPVLSLLLHGRMRQYRGIPAATVGAAMVGTALAGRTGTSILHFDALHSAARRAAVR